MTTQREFHEGLGITPAAWELVEQAEGALRAQFAAVDAVRLANQAKVLQAFRACRVESRHFAGTTGYGYDDIGRDLLDKLFAAVFHTEAALVRPQIVSGTHALALALYGVARRGSHILSITDRPYDTLLQTIGLAPAENGIESLIESGVRFTALPLLGNGNIDVSGACAALTADPTIDIVYLQRSRGYAWRNAVTIGAMAQAVGRLKALRPALIVLVDNCYGEFVEPQEPTDVGADLVIGSLIKNPGGGLAPTGGYLAGKAALIDRIQYRLTAPGIGMEVGSWPAGYLPFYQGLFLAPHVVGEAMKGAMLSACVFERQGYAVMPSTNDARSDITQSIRFDTEEKLLAFCRAVQGASPVDSHVVPEPWPMPGYQNDVVMAAGTFVQGASIELSADAPIKPPYIAYLQGGLTYEHCKLALMMELGKLL